MHFLLVQKLARVPLKNRLRLVIIIPGKCKYILLSKNVRTCNYLQRTCKYIPQGLSDFNFKISTCNLLINQFKNIVYNRFGKWKTPLGKTVHCVNQKSTNLMRMKYLHHFFKWISNVLILIMMIIKRFYDFFLIWKNTYI